MEKLMYNKDIFANIDEFRQALLYVSIKKIVQHFAEQEDIFPDGVTDEDHIHLFCYAYTLFTVHDFYQGKQLPDEDFTYCVSEFIEQIKENGYLSEQIPETLVEMRSLLKLYGDIHIAFIEDSANPDSLINYTNSILKTIPSTKHSGAFSLEGVVFSTELSAVLDYVARSYTLILEKSVKSTSTHEENSKVQEDMPKETPSDTISSQKTPVVTTPEKSRKNLGLILCAFLLLCSIVCNGWLYTENTSLKEDLIAREKEAAIREYENTYWYNAFKEKFVEARGNAEILEAHNFYNNYAVIITEQDSCYHKYGCPHVNLDSFWIYNVDAAIVDGYIACPSCNPPQ